ncbi:MAG: hypothetical protein ABI321_03670 [Polyangia bacterium]
MILLFVFIVPPVGYGWGYRGWGAPYPRYLQQRRAARAAAASGDASFDHQSWGWGGDVIWMICSVWIICALASYFWR